MMVSLRMIVDKIPKSEEYVLGGPGVGRPIAELKISPSQQTKQGGLAD